MNLKNRDLKWLLLMLLPIAIIPAAVHWKANRTSVYRGVLVHTDAEGERFSIGHLSFQLERDSTNSITVSYSTPEYDYKWNKAVKNGTRIYKQWDYRLSYNRHLKTLTKTLDTDLSNESNPTRTWRWQNVEESAIHKVAAPMREFFKTENHQGIKNKGNRLSELQKYGAKLAR